MRRIFGAKKKVVEAPTLEETTDKLNSRGDTLDEKIKKLEGEMAKYRTQLKKTKPGPAQTGIKQRAMRVLKQKKMYEQQRDQLANQSFNLEQVSFATENMKTTQSTVASMKAANAGIKKEFKSIDLNEIEALQDDMADMLDMSNEIQETLGQTFGVPDDIDEDELMCELDALEDDMGDETEAVPSYLQEDPTEELELPSAPEGELAREEGIAAPKTEA